MAQTTYDILELMTEGDFINDPDPGRQLWIYVTSVESGSAEGAIRKADPVVAIGDEKVYLAIPQSNVNAFSVGVKIDKDFNKIGITR